MKTQFRPLLAYNAIDTLITYPVLVSPKIDGIRCLMGPDGPISRTLKKIPNLYIQQYLKKCPPGLDGELVVGTTFQQSTSGIMSFEGQPDFTYWVFDCFTDPKAPFQERLFTASCLIEECESVLGPACRIKLLMHQAVKNKNDLDVAEAWALEGGFEGLMIRSPFGHYKYGRSTSNERLLGKIKRFEDREAVVVGIEPLFRNENPPEKDALGLQKRAHLDSLKIETELLGALVVKDSLFQEEFRIGTGFTEAQRKSFFHSPPLGQTVKYKYLPHGTLNLPRHPVFLGFRLQDDL
jgi:DNA ligase-1